MTLIKDTFKWDGPSDDNGTISDRPAIVLDWQQTKAIVEELNAREPERMALHREDLEQASALGAAGVPAHVDVGGLSILVGVSAAMISEMRGESPRVLALFIRLLMGQCAPKGVGGPFLLKVAIDLMKGEGGEVFTGSINVGDSSQIGQLLGGLLGGRGEKPAKIDDETADKVNRLLDGLRKGGQSLN